MSDENTSILEQANAAIRRNDHEGFLAFCTEDTRWTFVGDATLDGKEAVRAWMAENYRQPPTFTVDRMISDGEFVVALGDIEVTDAEGRRATHAYCDVWRFRAHRMVELQAFVVGSS
jgi:uncharacterized protein (TIGR02246 family)